MKNVLEVEDNRLNGLGQINFKKSDFLIMFVLFPFFYPKGFSEYFSIYKLFFTLWTYGASLIVLMLSVYKIRRGFDKYKNIFLILLCYFGYFCVDTLIIQGGVSEGIQKIFITPVLCLFCYICLEERFEQFIRCIAIILVLIFTLNITICSPIVFGKYFSVDGHLLFIGHVQVAAQLGIVGIFLGQILRRLQYKKLSAALQILSVLTIIMSDTAGGKIVLVMYVVFIVIDKLPYIRHMLFADSKWYVLAGLSLNILLFGLLFILNGKYTLFGMDLSLNGRMFVWKACMDLVKGAWLLGYGAYGVLIKVFWHGANEGMNYAHNEVLQKLLDGGVIYLILFVILLFAVASNVKHVADKTLRKNANVALFVVFILMLIESVTEYYYIYILWMLIAFLPEAQKVITEKSVRRDE